MNDWEKKSFKNLLPKHLGLSLTGQVNWNNRNSVTSFLLLKSMTGITVYLCCRKKQFLNALSNRDISIQLTIPISCKSRKKTDHQECGGKEKLLGYLWTEYEFPDKRSPKTRIFPHFCSPRKSSRINSSCCLPEVCPLHSNFLHLNEYPYFQELSSQFRGKNQQ